MDSIKKYTIREKFEVLPHGEYAQTLVSACRKLGISESHLRKIWGYTIDSTNEAKPSQLLILAEFFECAVEDLINQLIQQA